jgi:hypothetical protein
MIDVPPTLALSGAPRAAAASGAATPAVVMSLALPFHLQQAGYPQPPSGGGHEGPVGCEAGHAAPALLCLRSGHFA